MNVAAACALTALACGCATQGPRLAEGPAAGGAAAGACGEASAFTYDQAATPIGVFSEYRINPGDLLDVLFQIKTWTEEQQFVLAVDHAISVKFPKSPELSEGQTVRPDGKISLPYIGELYVVGMTVDELSADLKKRYAAILKDPELYVMVPEFRSAIKELKTDLHTAPRGLSRLVTVRPDGYATFAMVGDVFVAGKTVPAVNAILNEKYKAVLPGLTVDLFLEKQEGSLVYVLGEVRTPGPYPIHKPIPVIDAIALAGSQTKSGMLNEVIVIRRCGDKMTATKVNVKKQLRTAEDTQFVYLQPDDVVYVPKSAIRRMGDVMRDVADILLFNGWSIGMSYDVLSDVKTTTKTTSTTISTAVDVNGRSSSSQSTTTSSSESKEGSGPNQ